MSIAARRERERRERRTSILDAAREVFTEKGFDHATMDDIATTAELSKGTLYLYFKSKDALFIALVTRMMTGLADDVERLADTSKCGLDAVRAILTSYVANMLEHPQLFRIMVGQLASGRLIDPHNPWFAAHREQVERVVSAFVTAVERGRRDGSLRADVDAHQTSTQLWGGLLGIMLIRINGAEMQRRMPQPNLDLESFVDGYIQLVCDGLRPRIHDDDVGDNDHDSNNDNRVVGDGDREVIR